MVFRRDNKVDAFQRQMSSLRQQIGNAQGVTPDYDAPIPDLEDERFPREAYTPPQSNREQDTGGYSFGTYPSGTADSPEPAPDRMEAAIPQIPASDGAISVIAKGTLWKGELEAEGSIHAFGRVEGSLRAKEDIWIADGADVNASVQARRVIVGGSVSGSIRAVDRFEALPQCLVNADVQAPIFVVHEGANISGQMKMGSSDTPETRSDRSGSPAIIQRRARTGA
ncbi:MAG: polymer-forming cytoskeletal protein [Thermomicrobiales bacterium]